MKEFPRKWHEDFAITSTKEAVRLSRHDYGCGKQALDNIIEANRNVAAARTHLISMGPHSSKRTMRLWRMIGKAEKQVEESGLRFLRCTVNRRRGR